MTKKLNQAGFWALEAVLLLTSAAVAVWTTRTADWHPLLLVVMLFALSVGGQLFGTSIGTGRLSTAHVPFVLAMVLLGPGPAVLFGLTAAALTSAQRRLPAEHWLNNLLNFTLYPLVGSLVVRALAGNVHDLHDASTHGLLFGLIVFGVFIITLVANFLVLAVDIRVGGGRSVIRQAREEFIPVLPGHLATAVLAAILAVAYTNLGLTVLFAAVLVLVIFQYLTTALFRSEERADQLEARSIQLASMQFGVLATLMDALALRDRATARHAASVARYAKKLAIVLGCREEEQETIHTAALLHDIGKFTLPDRILNAELLSDDDWSIVRRHPQDGAALVGKLDGYGPVADAILYHHEHVDGAGYPAGLIGKEIPLASRIIAICSTYDTLTAHDSYRPTMTPQDAIAELRRVAGRQLDDELVTAFIAMLEEEGPTAMFTDEPADFSTELAFEQRVRRIAIPAGR